MASAHSRGEWWQVCTGRCPTLCLAREEPIPPEESGEAGPDVVDVGYGRWLDRTGVPAAHGDLWSGPEVLRLERMPSRLQGLERWLRTLERLELEVSRTGLKVSDLAFGVGPWLTRSAPPELEITVEVAESVAMAAFEKTLLRFRPRPTELVVWIRGGHRLKRARRRIRALGALAWHLRSSLRLGWTLGEGPPSTVKELAGLAGDLGCEWLVRRGHGGRHDPIARRHYAYLERFAEYLDQAEALGARWVHQNRCEWRAEPLMARVPFGDGAGSGDGEARRRPTRRRRGKEWKVGGGIGV